MWGRLDDGWYDHPKVVACGPIGMALHAWSISYCSRHLTDGYVRKGALPTWARPATRTLVDNGLFDELVGGFMVHDYLDWNPSRNQVLHERELAAARKDRWKAHRSGVPDGGKDTNGTE
jgi:hypothetical protein